MLAPSPQRPETRSRLQLFAGLTSIGVAIVVLIGWSTNNDMLTRVLSTTIAMNPMTAVVLVALSMAMLLRSPRSAGLVYVLASATIFVGTMKLLQLALGMTGGIDQMLFADRLDTTNGQPNRMAPNTAFALAALGLALLTSQAANPRTIIFSQVMCLLAGATAAAALVGYLVDLVALYQVHKFIAMALPTAFALVLLSLAVASLNPQSGLMRVFSDRGPAGSLARIALPLALLVPLVVGVTGLLGERAGYYGTEAAVAIALITNVLVNFVLLGGCAIALYRTDLERQQREAAITRSENQYRQAERAGHVGYWKLELPGRAVQWSDGFTRICDLPEGMEPNVESALAVFHPDDALLVRMSLAQAEEFGANWEIASRICRPDGSTRYVKSYGVCERDELGRTVEVFGVICDVTDLETARLDAEAAKSTTASFLANMSHEIRTPMNGMMGFVELLLDSDLNPGQRRHLGLVQNSANALLKLLNDILDISKIEAGRLEIAEAPYNARHGIRQCVRLMNPMAEQKALSLTLSIADDFPAHLLVDGLRLRQILLNLIGNAIKFTHRGAISVVIEKTVGSDGKEVIRASVADSGIGIDPDRVATIFDAFVQAELTTTRRFGGSGLGLSISRQLAEMMGGTIEVDSVLGKGTRMTLVLPLVESSEPAVAEAIAIESSVPDLADEPETGAGQASILLVEDVDINQELFSQMLAKLGHRFHIASNGAEAVDLAQRLEADPAAWDLILMDLQMPVMDGLTATTTIRQLGGRAATIPIVALTASAFEEERRACESAGMNDHLAKPVGIEALRRMINRWQGTPESPVVEELAPARSASLDRKIKARLRSSAERLEEIVDELTGAGPDQLVELLGEAAKITHVLAGTAGMVGEEALGDLASATEEKIASWAKRKSAPALITARTAIERLVAALNAKQSGPDELQAREA